MKIWAYIVIVVLGLIAVVAIVFALFSQSSATTYSKKLAAEELMASQTVSALNIAQATADANLAEAVTAQISAEAIIAAASKAQADLYKKVADYSSQLKNEREKSAALEAATMCESKPKSIDYSGNSSVSNSIKTWLEDTHGKIDNTTWDSVYSNSKTTIHKLTGEFLFVYLVYFDDPDMGYSNSVFDFTNACWLDR